MGILFRKQFELRKVSQKYARVLESVLSLNLCYAIYNLHDLCSSIFASVSETVRGMRIVKSAYCAGEDEMK